MIHQTDVWNVNIIFLYIYYVHEMNFFLHMYNQWCSSTSNRANDIYCDIHFIFILSDFLNTFRFYTSYNSLSKIYSYFLQTQCLTGKENCSESGLVHRAVWLKFNAQCIGLWSYHRRCFLTAIHPVLPEFIRTNFAVYLHSVVFAFSLRRKKNKVNITSNTEL